MFVRMCILLVVCEALSQRQVPRQPCSSGMCIIHETEAPDFPIEKGPRDTTATPDLPIYIDPHGGKKGYGDTCTVVGDMCWSEYTCVHGVNKCLCVEGSYYIGSTCKSTNVLKPILLGYNKTHNSVALSWTSPSASGYTNSYIIKYRVTGGTIKIHHVNGQDVSTLIQHLRQGTSYMFSVVRSITRYSRTQTVPESDLYHVTTTTEKVYGDSCSAGSTDDCQTGLSCISTVKKCLCADGSYYTDISYEEEEEEEEDVNEEYEEDAGESYYTGTTCTSTNVLKPISLKNVKAHNSVTLSWISPSASGYTNSYVIKYRVLGRTVMSHHVNGQDVSTVIRNLSPATTYIFTVIRSIRKESRSQSVPASDPYQVTTNGVYSDNCTGGSSECGDGLACLPASTGKMCLCEEGNFFNGSTCTSTTALRPTISSTIDSSTSSVTVTWNSPPATGYTNTYLIKYLETGTTLVQNSPVSGGLSSHRVTGLKAGTSYTFIVVRSITREGRTQTVIESLEVNGTSERLDYGSACNEDQCQNILSCITGKCLCADGNYYTDNSCISTTALIPTISSIQPTSISSVTVIWNSTQATGYTNSYVIKYIEEGTTFVETRPVSGDVSSRRVTGLKAGTSYTFTVVRSITRQGRTQTIVDSLGVNGTLEKIDYGEHCVSNGTCKNLDTNCYSSTCRCNAGYFWTDTACLANVNLSPSNIHTETFSTTQLRFTWTASAYPEVISGYLVELSPPIPSENIVIIGTSANISSLTPGERYSITVSSRSSYLNRGETASAGVASDITKPLPTVGLAPGSFLTEPRAQIYFYRAEGRADSYTITLSGDDYSINKTASGSKETLSASFPGVTAGSYYNISIITNSFGLSSDLFTQMIRIRTGASEAVDDLTVYGVTSRKASVSWKRPINTKGALYKYTMEVYNSSTCVQRLNMKCKECLQAMNVTVSSEARCTREIDRIISQSDLNNLNFLVRYDLSLLPATAYEVFVAAYNEEGKGQTDQETVLTEEEAPRYPTAFRYISKTSESVELKWSPPKPRPGVTVYIIKVYEWYEDRNQYMIFNNFSKEGFFNVSMNITGLSSYWKYRFEMFAKTSKGVSSTVDGPEVSTDEAAPIAVENLEHQPVDGVYNRYQLSWRCPPQKHGRNGVIRSATVITSSFTQLDDVNPELGQHNFDNTDCTWSEQITVIPEFNYTFEVFISNSQKGESSIFQVYMPGGPPSFVVTERRIIEIVSRTETEKSVELMTCPTCILDNTNGVIVKSGVLVCAKGDCPIGNVAEVRSADDFDKSPSWDKASGVSFSTWYRATQDDWLKGQEASDEIRFVLGDESCGLQDQNRFCNGPLPVDRTYRVWLFACTRVSCSEGDYVEFTTAINDNSMPLPIFAAIVTAAVLVVLGVLVAVFLVVYIKVIRPRSQTQRSEKYVSDTSPEDDTYEKIGDVGRLSVIDDCRPEVDNYNDKDSPPRSENTYDKLAVYSNVGQNDYAKIQDTQA